MTDIHRPRVRNPRSMVIEVRVDQQHPLVGTVAVEGESTATFEGWLDLLAALSQLLERTPVSGGSEL